MAELRRIPWERVDAVRHMAAGADTTALFHG
jgi:hypothetical protein